MKHLGVNDDGTPVNEFWEGIHAREAGRTQYENPYNGGEFRDMKKSRMWREGWRMKNESIKERKQAVEFWVYLLTLLVVIAVCLTLYVRGFTACNREGGVYIRGAMWFVCIEKGEH